MRLRKQARKKGGHTARSITQTLATEPAQHRLRRSSYERTAPDTKLGTISAGAGPLPAPERQGRLGKWVRIWHFHLLQEGSASRQVSDSGTKSQTGRALGCPATANDEHAPLVRQAR